MKNSKYTSLQFLLLIFLHLSYSSMANFSININENFRAITTISNVSTNTLKHIKDSLAVLSDNQHKALKSKASQNITNFTLILQLNAHIRAIIKSLFNFI